MCQNVRIERRTRNVCANLSSERAMLSVLPDIGLTNLWNVFSSSSLLFLRAADSLFYSVWAIAFCACVRVRNCFCSVLFSLFLPSAHLVVYWSNKVTWKMRIIFPCSKVRIGNLNPCLLESRKNATFRNCFHHRTPKRLTFGVRTLILVVLIMQWYDFQPHFLFERWGVSKTFLIWKIAIIRNSGGLSIWKYQFLVNYWSQAMLSTVSTWVGDCSSVAWVLLLTLKVG